MTDLAAAGASAVPATAATRPREGIGLRALAGLTAQLALAWAVVWVFQIEGPGFRRLVPLVVAGFVGHALLPLAWRLPAFTLLSLAAAPLVLEPEVAAWVVGLGLALVAICHLPIAWRWRIGLLLLVGGGAALAKGALLSTPVPPGVWSVLAGLFALRILIYVYDVRHATQPVGPLKTLAYFFMLPNVCFLLFPVVDFKTFDRTHYNEAPATIYQRGLRWIAMGLLQLLAYRVVYQEITLDVTQVHSGGQLLQYVFTTLLLYTRVSGQFHLIVGLLLLFGFNLPRSNNRYLLATSFTDLWRRINIYWKDMMMKLVYYPSFFALRRRWPQGSSVILATGIVFVVTWALHSWLWFWARGAVLLSWTDVAFWSAVGVLVVWSTWRELKAGPKRVLGTGAPGWSGRRGVRILGIFTLFSLLWSLWSAESLGVWAGALSTVTTLRWTEGLLWLGLAGAFVLFAGWNWDAIAQRQEADARWDGGLAPTALLCGLLALSPARAPSWIPDPLTGYVQALHKSGLNKVDKERMGRNYYEQINESGARALGVQESRRGNPWLEVHGAAHQVRSDFLVRSLIPGAKLSADGMPFSVNSQGLRDQEYSLAKPAGVQRIAVVGSSIVMGLGVADGTTFEALLEERLAQDSAVPPHEILNFGIGGLSHVQAVFVTEHLARPYDPDLLLFTIHEPDPVFLARHLRHVLEQGVAIPYPEVARIVEQAGLHAGMSEGEALRRMEPLNDELSRASFHRLAAWGRERGIPVLAIALPIPLEGSGARLATYIEMVQEAGLGVIDLRDIWAGQDEARMVIRPEDHHPNTEGHRILAERLYRELRARPDLLGIPPTKPAISAPSRTP